MARARDALLKHAGLAGVVAVALAVALHASTRGFSAAERAFYDFCIATSPRAPADALVVVTDGAPQDVGTPTRARLARLADRLTQAGAGLIVLAVPLDRPQDDAGDAQLAQSLHANGHVVLAAPGKAAPLAIFAKEALAAGEMALALDSDGVLRSQVLFAGPDGKGAPVAALVAAAERIGVPQSQVRRIAGVGVQVGANVVATEDDGGVRPQFYRASGGASAIPTLPLADVLDGHVAASALRGKTVFVGAAAANAGRVRTPSGVLAPVEVLAQVTSAIATRQLTVQPGWAQGAMLLASAAVAALVALRFPALRSRSRWGAALGLSLGLVALQWLLYAWPGWWVPLALPVAMLWCGVLVSLLWTLAARGVLPGRRGTLSAGTADAVPTAPAAPVPASTSAPRLRLGPYVIEREIGRGAMGAVYLTRDARDGRAVAIKTTALGRDCGETALREARQRFIREAQTARRLRHPDIVAVHDAGETRDQAWIAMDWVPGHDLSRHTRVGTLMPAHAVVRIVARVAAALAHAHRQGVVHRDVKPANVMVDSESDLVKVMDFGIAHLADGVRTRTGVVLGTPSYMAPEQLAGQPPDARSDLYSLGVTLFQLLTGHLPHEADSPARLMSQIANEAAPDVRSWRPDLPEALANVVALALEKRVALRYADGDQIARDLRAIESRLGAARIFQSDRLQRDAAVGVDSGARWADDPRHNARL